MSLIASGIAGGIGILASAFVKEGEIGCITTFGKAQRNTDGKIKLVKPGFLFIIPIIQKVNKVHTRKNTDQFTGLQVTLNNGLSYKFNAYIIYHVATDPNSVESVLFEIEDYKELVSVTFEKTIQTVIQNAEYIDPEKFSSEIKSAIYNSLKEQGIIVEECGLTSFSATDSSQSLIGINYRLNLAKQNKDLPISIISAAIGATPVVNVDNTTMIKQETEETDSWFS